MKTRVIGVCVSMLCSLSLVVPAHAIFGVTRQDAQEIYRSVVQVKATKQNFSSTQAVAKKQAIASILNSFSKTPINSFTSGQDLLKFPKMRTLLEGVVGRYGKFKSVTLRVAGVPVVKMTVEIPAMQLVSPALAYCKKQGLSIEKLKSLVMKVATGRQKVITKQFTSGPYTSLIIDASGLGLKRAMSPKIRRDDGSEVWGTVKVDADYVIDHGIVSYVDSLESAKNDDRAGDNPLVIQAIGISGGKFLCDPVIDDNDSKYILDEDKEAHFLDKFSVIFVK